MKKTLILTLMLALTTWCSARNLSSKYTGSAEVGGISGSGWSLFMINTTHGLQLNKRWFAGGGVKFLSGDNTVGAFYGDARCYSTRPRCQKWTPYGEVKCGYEFGNVDFQPFIEPSAGVRYRINDRIALTASLGWYCDGSHGVTYTIGVQF